jgi:dihydrodipicolinate synthase/N-acetylneuraminate lyase
MTDASLLKGVIVPATTPFSVTEEIDEKAFAAQLEWLVAQGVQGIVLGGSTGEGYTLTDDEFVRLVDLAIEVVGPKLPVLGGIIADSTQAAVRRSKLVVGRRLAGLQVAPPHYIFSPSEEGMIGFYRSLAEATPFPLLIYNVIPWATVSPRQAGEIMRAVPSVIAIKQSGTDFGIYADLVRTVGGHRVFAAIDAALISCYELGASGSIAAIATATPRASVRLWQAVAAGRREEAMALHRALLEVWGALAGPNLPAKVKAAQELQGVPASYPRAPMALASSLERERIASALAGLK